MANEYTGFYFSLDEILDTRLAVLDIINPDATLELLQNGYFERESDNWELLTNGKIKNDEFKAIYSKRNKDVLKRSKLSGFGFYLKDFIIDVEKMFGTDPTINLPKIYLNIFPYTDLTEEEIDAVKFATEIACCCTLTEVEICCYKPEDITPLKIKNDFDFSFMYHFEDWKNIHVEMIGTQIMMGSYITAPKLYIEEIPKEEDNEIDDGVKMSAWQAAELCMLPFMVLNFLPVKHFSLFKP